MKITEAVYEGYADVQDVPLWKTHGCQAKADDRMEIVNDPLGKRGKVMRVEVRPGDSGVAGSNQGERADVMCSASVVPMKEGSIVAVSCPIMLPNEFQSNNSGWNVCFGGHDKSGNTQSPIQFEIRNSKDLRLRIFGGTPSGGVGDFRADLGPWPLEKNRWYDLVYGNQFSWEPTKGRTVVMLDGKKVEDRKVANLYRDSYCYHKQGWYRVAQSYTTVLYFDSTRFYTAATLDLALAEASGGTVPEPPPEPVSTTRADLEKEWAVFMENQGDPAKRGTWTQDQRWRADNQGELQALLAYRSGGERPTLKSATGRRMVEHISAWLQVKDEGKTAS